MSPFDFIDFTKPRLAHALRTVQTGGYATACPALSAEEKALIYHYTYQGSDEIKVPIRLKNGLVDEPLGLGLVAALHKLPAHTGQVYSAELWDAQELAALHLKAVVSDAGFSGTKRWPTFLSASTTRRIAMQHLESFGGQKNCILSIFSRTGRYIDELSHHGIHGRDPLATETEVLFLPNTLFRVVSVHRATTHTEIQLVEL